MFYGAKKGKVSREEEINIVFCGIKLRFFVPGRSGEEHFTVHQDHTDQQDQSEKEVVVHGSSFWVNNTTLVYGRLRGRLREG